MDTTKKFLGTKANYEKEFNGKQKDAINVALDIRKFEIDLYWKRAAYYWTLIAAIFAAYFLLHKIEPKEHILLFVVSSVGFTLSVAWYLANRGSKFWINNWEMHVDYLEDEIIGPLYKTVAGSEKFKFHKLLTAYPYSVAKINQVVNLYIAGIWLFFSIYTLSMKFNWTEPFSHFNYFIISTFTLIALFLLFFCTKTNFEGRVNYNGNEAQNFLQRLLPTDQENNENT